MNWIKIGGYLLIVVPTLFLGIVIGFYLIQDYMIFLGERLPSNHQFFFKNKYEELNFKTPDGHTLNALLFKVDDPKGIVYYHHGNAGNLQGWGNFAGNFLRLGYDVFLYDYRGYGKSTSRIKKQSNLLDDAEYLLNELRENNNYQKIIYYGISLGTGVASKLALDHPPTALILETPYYNFYDLIHYHYPYLPAKMMSKYSLRTDKYLKGVECPVMLIHGTDDEIVPFDSSVRLADINESFRLVSIRHGVHNNLTDFELYHSELKKFLDKI